MTNSYLDLVENFSLLSASDTIFRHCLSIAELFVQNWIYFPVAITEENVQTVYSPLSHSHSEVVPNTFSFALLEESFFDYKCIMQVLIEIMRYVTVLLCLNARNPKSVISFQTWSLSSFLCILIHAFPFS